MVEPHDWVPPPESTTFQSATNPSLTAPLREERTLNLGEFHRRRAFFVVVSRVIDPRPSSRVYFKNFRLVLSDLEPRRV
jgi:hypothetical protein